MIQANKRDLNARICHLGGRISKRDRQIAEQLIMIKKKDIIIEYLESKLEGKKNG